MELKNALRGKNEDYIRKYLADILAKTEGEDFRIFLQKSPVFRQPVEKTAYESFGSGSLLSRGVDLTLFEREQAGQQEPVYWVAPVIREAEWQELPGPDQRQMHGLALDYYDTQLADDEQPNYAALREAVHHALEGGEIRVGVQACHSVRQVSVRPAVLRRTILYCSKASLAAFRSK
ncbi:hypothetical protein MJD09_21100 [bacterium]|nr:hypothetical protein [bacterium]